MHFATRFAASFLVALGLAGCVVYEPVPADPMQAPWQSAIDWMAIWVPCRWWTRLPNCKRKLLQKPSGKWPSNRLPQWWNGNVSTSIRVRKRSFVETDVNAGFSG